MKKYIILLLFLFSVDGFAANVAPVITDPVQIEAAEDEREKIFAQLIEDPTNLDQLFKYANLSILLGDLEAAIGVLEQMLIYEPDLPRIKLELGVLYFRLGAFASAKLYLNSAKQYDPPTEVMEKVDDFLEAISEEEEPFEFEHLISGGFNFATNGNSGINVDIIEIAGFPLEVSEDSKGIADVNQLMSYSFKATQDLRHPRGDTITHFISFSDQRLNSFHQFDISTAVLSINRIFNLQGNPDFFLTRPVISLGGTGFKVLLADKSLLSSSRLAMDFGGSTSDKNYLSLGVYIDNRNFSRNSDKSGQITGFEVGNNLLFSQYDSVLELKYSFDKFHAKVPWEDYNLNSFEISGSKKLKKNWNMKASLSYKQRSHNEPLPTFGTRKDKVNSLDFGFSKLLHPCWFTKFNLNFINTKSKVGIFQRKNNQLGMEYSYLCLGPFRK